MPVVINDLEVITSPTPASNGSAPRPQPAPAAPRNDRRVVAWVLKRLNHRASRLHSD